MNIFRKEKTEPNKAKDFREACKRNDMQAIQDFIANGDATSTEDGHYTLLHYAVLESRIEIIRELIKAGAPLNAFTSNDATPLHMAIYMERLQVVKGLIQAGADVNAKRENDSTSILNYAIQKGQFDCVAELVKAKADVNEIDFYGESILHNAATMGNAQIVAFLIRSGARTDVNWDGRYPKDVATGDAKVVFEQFELDGLAGGQKNDSDLNTI